MKIKDLSKVIKPEEEKAYMIMDTPPPPSPSSSEPLMEELRKIWDRLDKLESSRFFD